MSKLCAAANPTTGIGRKVSLYGGRGSIQSISEKDCCLRRCFLAAGLIEADFQNITGFTDNAFCEKKAMYQLKIMPGSAHGDAERFLNDFSTALIGKAYGERIFNRQKVGFRNELIGAADTLFNYPNAAPCICLRGDRFCAAWWHSLSRLNLSAEPVDDGFGHGFFVGWLIEAVVRAIDID